jgi:hypothetical protein
MVPSARIGVSNTNPLKVQCLYEYQYCTLLYKVMRGLRYRLKMVRLQEYQGLYKITVPSGMVRMKNWTKGQDLFFIFNERGNIEITDSTPTTKKLK